MMKQWMLSILVIKLIAAELEVSKEEYAMLPRIYDFNETEICPVHHMYCKIDVKLKPIDENNPSELWRVLEKINKSERTLFRRDMVYRGVCVEPNGLRKGQEVYKKDGVVGCVENMHCFGNFKLSEFVKMSDILFVLMSTCYICFLIYCTVRCYSSEKSNCSQKVNRYIEIFSICNIWRGIRKPCKNEDFKNLISIQGMRTIATALVIESHTIMRIVTMFSQNPEYIEDIYANPFLRLIPNLSGLLVQFFFVISAWLLAVQLNNIVRKNGELTIRDVLVLALNRYFRLIPAMIVVRSIFAFAPALPLLAPLYRPVPMLEIVRCNTLWFTNFLFIQNIPIIEVDTCAIHTWYLGADTQMFLFTVVLFYVSKKLKISMKTLLGVPVGAAVCLQVYIVTTTDFPGLFRDYPSLLPSEAALIRPVLLYNYGSTHCNLATYAIGFAFGTVYSKKKGTELFDTFLKKTAWLCSFLGLPLLAVVLHCHEYSNRWMEALMSISLRPMFSFGLAIGILGMATNTGGYVKKFCESGPLVFLGDFTYSVYMFHLSLVLGRMCMWDSMPYLSYSFHIYNALTDIIGSFAVGFIMYVILEYPCLQLQKMILPQIQTKRRIEGIKEH